MIKKLVWIISFLSFSCLAQTQLEINNTACVQYTKANIERNKTYQNIIKQYRNDSVFISKFTNAEKQWLVFRDAYIEARYPHDSSEYGSIFPMCRCMVLFDITQEHLKQLKKWETGLPEGNPCSGSIVSH